MTWKTSVPGATLAGVLASPSKADMIHRLNKLNYNHKAELLEQAREVLQGWEEDGNPKIVWEYGYHTCQLNNEDEGYLVLYKCQCGKLIADEDDYGGRDYECDVCPKCNRHYDE